MEQKKEMNLPKIKEEVSEINKLHDQLGDKTIQTIKGLVNPDLTDRELLVFLSFADKLGLNALVGEIIPIVYYKNSPDKRRVNYIVTRTGKRVIAARTGELEKVDTRAIYVRPVKNEKGVVVKNERVAAWEGGKLWGAESTVTRKGVDYYAIVRLDEYSTGKDVWASKPDTMIRKVAESQALSMAFPEVLGQVYDESEVGTVDKGSVEVEDPDKPATDAQKSTMKSLGIDFTDSVTYEEAKKLISDKVNESK